MKNKIIIEGFWGIGKSTLIKTFERDGYKVIHEPDHLHENNPPKNLYSWYSAKHRENIKTFNQYTDGSKVVMERSLLDSAAYAYAKGELYEETLVNDFIEMYRNNKPLIVFIYANKEILKQNISAIKDENVKKNMQSDDFIERLEDFFRKKITFLYDIHALFVNICNEDGSRRTPEDLRAIIDKAIENNRFAQVNAAAFKVSDDGEPAFLILKRNEKKGGFWQTMSGGVKGIHSVKETVLIELSEELNIHPEESRLLPIEYSFNYIGSEGYELNDYAFGYKLTKDEEITLSDEHVDSEFLPITEAKSLLKYDSNKNILEQVYKKIKSAHNF